MARRNPRFLECIVDGMSGIQLSGQTKIVNSSTEPIFNVFGPLHRFLVDPADTFGAFALMRATVPAGIGIPLHSHTDPEVFFILEGLLEVWQYDGYSGRWLTATFGDVICIPGDVRHAIRNASSSTVTLLLITTPKLYEFFREIARSCRSEEKAEAPNDQDMQRLLALAARYNYWIGSAQENEVIGFTKFSQREGLVEH